MRIESNRLGTVMIDDSSIITMPDGLLGFESHQRFALIPADEVGAYSWLHSVDDPQLAFLVVAPDFFFPDYAPDLPENEAALLELSDESDAQLLCLITITDDDITANLMGPVVLNVGTQVARQVVLADQGFDTRQQLGTS